MLLKMKCTHTTFTEGRDVSVAYFAWIWQVFPHPILIAITFNNNTMLKTEYSRSYNNTAVIWCSPIRKLRLCWISNKKQHGKKSEQNSLHSGMYIPAKIDPIQKVEIITIPNTSSNGWRIRFHGWQPVQIPWELDSVARNVRIPETWEVSVSRQKCALWWR